MINCRDCLLVLDSYIDRELSDEDIVQVRVHLQDCGGCLDLYRFEESVRRLVRVRCQEQSAPQGLRARIEVTLAMERMRQQSRRRPQRGVHLDQAPPG